MTAAKVYLENGHIIIRIIVNSLNPNPQTPSDGSVNTLPK